MNLRQLETFRDVVQLASFTKAAGRLNSTQSTISMRISDLENELGVQLLDRSQRRIEATPIGRRLLPYAVEMCRLREELFAEIGRADKLAATIRLGVAELVALTWLPDLVAKINEDYPNVEVDLEVGLTGDYFKKILNRESDLLFLATDGTCPSGLVYDPLYKIDFQYMASPSLNLHGRKLGSDELEQCHMISLAPSSAVAGIEDKWLRQNSIEAKKMTRSNSMEASARLVRSGLGMSLLPVSHYAKDIAEGHLVTLETMNAMPRVQFSAIHSESDVAPLTRIVLNYARQLASKSEFSRIWADI